MSQYDCDQFAADALSIRDEIRKETGVDVRFNIHVIEALVDDVDRAMSSKVVVDHDELRESVLGRHTFLHDIEHTAYQRLLDKIYKRRMGAKMSRDSKHSRWTPLAPR